MLAAALDSQNNVFVTGRQFVSSGKVQMLTMKLNVSNGHIDWTERLGGTAGEDDIAWDIVIGPDENPVITGQVVNGVDSAYFLTRKMQNSNGDEIWTTETPGYANNIVNRSGWLNLMDNGDLVLVNRVFGANGYDVFLERYRASDGEVMWTRTYDGETHGGDDPRAAMRDADGNILVAGVQDIAWNYNYMLVKFDATTGEPIWEADGYDGPGGGWWDVATCLVEGPGGEIIVGGLSDGSSTGTGWDYAIVAYDAASGDESWVERYDGPAGQSDEIRSIAVADDGVLYVTGYGYGVDTSKDMITLCYQLDMSSPVPDTRLTAGLTRAWPNPFNPRVNFSYELPTDARARLAIFDLRGRQITVLADGPHAAGSHTASWNGRDASGRTAPAGVYMAIVESGGVRSSRKIVLAK